MAVWEDEGQEYYSCPMLFVPINVGEWYGEYAYYQRLSGTAPGYWDQTERWTDAMSYYNGQLAHYNDLIQKRQESRMKAVTYVKND